MKTVEQLEAELDVARVKRYEQEVATEAAQRVNIALAGIEGYLIHLPEDIAAEFAALVAKAKSSTKG